jgi:hypothetical protein
MGYKIKELGGTIEAAALRAQKSPQRQLCSVLKVNQHQQPPAQYVPAKGEANPKVNNVIQCLCLGRHRGADRPAINQLRAR